MDAYMAVTLPDGANLQMHIEVSPDADAGDYYSLSALWQVTPLITSGWLPIEETGYRDLDIMFEDVSQFIKDLESGRKRLILEGNSQLVIVSV